MSVRTQHKFRKIRTFLHQKVRTSVFEEPPLFREMSALDKGLGLGTHFICQGISTRRQRSDLCGLRVKLPPVTSGRLLWTALSQQFFGSITTALSLSYSGRKVFSLCLFCEILRFIRFYARTLNKMNKS